MVYICVFIYNRYGTLHKISKQKILQNSIKSNNIKCLKYTTDTADAFLHSLQSSRTARVLTMHFIIQLSIMKIPIPKVQETAHIHTQNSCE